MEKPGYELTMTFCRGMATKKCAREECGKTVYPMEELNCLDKTWHKGCFKCTSCGMALNMKNYKGYNKNPYCDPHYPKISATVVSDTPDMQRVAINSKLQSQHQYHAEYEKMKGTKIDVGNDDPEISRHLKNTKTQSNVQYHNEIERKQKYEANRPLDDPNEKPSIKLAETSIHVNESQEPTVYVITVERSSTESHLNAPTNGQPNHTIDYQITNKENFATTIWSSNNFAINDAEPVKVGKISDYDPLEAEKKASTEATNKSTAKVASNTTSNATDESKTGKKTTKKAKATGFSVKALYDYTAADSDEISFKEGDIIVNCQAVDDGWLTGTLQNSLETGMLPANYVEKIIVKTGQSRLG